MEKSRGQDFITGSHAMTIESGKGIRIYQRAQSAPQVNSDQPTSTTRIASGKLQIFYESPLEFDADVHFSRVLDLIEKHDVDCVVFDSVAVYESAAPGDVADFLYALANFIKGRLATAYFNYESPELLGISQISEDLKGSHLVDNIVLLN